MTADGDPARSEPGDGSLSCVPIVAGVAGWLASLAEPASCCLRRDSRSCGVNNRVVGLPGWVEGPASGVTGVATASCRATDSAWLVGVETPLLLPVSLPTDGTLALAAPALAIDVLRARENRASAVMEMVGAAAAAAGAEPTPGCTVDADGAAIHADGSAAECAECNVSAPVPPPPPPPLPWVVGTATSAASSKYPSAPHARTWIVAASP